MGIWTGPRARRIDIDLLRAVAVLAVLFFHFDVPGFDGGFLGVDIFFVISGYLISLHIQQQLAAEKFSFRRFYLRRIRRLYPALIATLVLSSAAAVFILPRSLLEDFSHSQIASAVYVSNVYFWSVADYFDTASVLKPLLHTWSLSVEEQFYLVWPLFLALTFTRWPRMAIVLALLISLAAAEWVQSTSPSSAFFLFPFRIFEFALGTLVCGVSLQHWPRWSRNLALIISTAAILVSVSLVDEQSRNPGLVTLPLCVATALIIALRHDWANRLNRVSHVFLRIGLVSYSAYLVHWPLVVFYKIERPGSLELTTAGVMLMVTYLLAEAMYQWVERPTATIDLRRRRSALWWSIPGVLALALVINAGWPHVYGMLHRSNVSVIEVLDRIPPYRHVRDQAREEARALADGKLEAGFRKILVIGDSHAVDVRMALQLVLPPQRYFVDLMFSICDPLAAESIEAPLLEHYRNHGQKRTHDPDYCSDYHAEFLDAVAENAPDLVVFSESWRRTTLPYLGDTLNRLQQKTDAPLLVLGRNTQWIGTPEVAFRKLESLQDLDRSAWDLRNERYEDFDQTLRDIAARSGALFMSKNELVCPGAQCKVLIEGEFGYTDAQHWTVPGLKFYGARLAEHPEFERAKELAGKTQAD